MNPETVRILAAISPWESRVCEILDVDNRVLASGQAYYKQSGQWTFEPIPLCLLGTLTESAEFLRLPEIDPLPIREVSAHQNHVHFRLVDFEFQ